MNALIVSLNFHPGHVSHMIASYMQCKELGYEPIFYVDKEFCNFLPKDSNIVTSNISAPIADIAIFLFPSQKNLHLIYKFKKGHCKVIYIFHEPLAPLTIYKEAGFSWKYLAKLWVINRISALTVKWSDVILLPSKKAIKYYEENKLYSNRNYHYLPLMYTDEYQQHHESINRKYFSYIGTVAVDHSFSEYLNFVEWCIENHKLESIRFLIATKSKFIVPHNLQNSPRITIQQGRPLSDEEINYYYASSIVVWNAYARTTQSGVLAKSFMFGTPAITLSININEFTIDGENVVAISNNRDFDEIESAIKQISNNFQTYSSSCRQEFENTFYYKNYNKILKNIIDGTLN